ncbi:Ig-like domain-containing protein [Marinobacter sp. KMM 10035]|uniref:Ig-like domain-containing protein n=1 Tax=Marinobacter sp. KMM 10035 TaxID=3134034 RepID=UPI00397BAFA5
MKHRLLTLPLLASLIVACSDSDTLELTPKLANPDLVYSYPTDGQRNVSPATDVVLRFSEPVDSDSLQRSARLRSEVGDVDYVITSIDDGYSVLLTPAEPLVTGTNYEVVFNNPVLAQDGREIRNLNDNLANDAPGIQFITRGGFTGFKNVDSAGQNFAVATINPAPNTLFEPSDFASFRIELTHPAHPDWQVLGGTIELLDAQGDKVPANVFVQDRRITLDPCIAEGADNCGLPGDNLTGGERYKLSVKDFPAITGERLTYASQFLAKSTKPTVVQFQNVTDPGITEGNAELVLSKLNGQPVNGVILNSVLLGNTDVSESSGGLYSELAFAPAFGADEALPIRVPRGTRLTGSSVGVRANGTVPVLDERTGQAQTTGALVITMITDATGYLIPNPYTDDIHAPSHVRLFIDVSMSTEMASPNAALTQNLLHAELVGIAQVEDGLLKIDVLGVLEPALLGREVADSTIAFQITGDTSVDAQLAAFDDRESDREPPGLLSWSPGTLGEKDFAPDMGKLHRPGDPVTLFFDEPILESSVATGVILKAGASEVPVNYRVDGSSVSLNPEGGLKHGVTYFVELNSNLTDLAGNGFPQQVLEFELPDLGTGVAKVSPLPLTTYPGYPCVTVGLDLASNKHGQCVDGAIDGPLGEVIPLSRLPANRPISVLFSQSLDESTVRLGETFKVDSVNEDGTTRVENVPGRLEFSNQRIRFFPAEPWQRDALYRYTLASSQGGGCDNAICSETDQNGLGLPLQTDLLVNSEDIGGPDLEIYFRGAPQTDHVFVPLRSVPVRDANSNYVIDCNSASDCLEPFDHEPYPAGQSAPTVYKPSKNATTILSGGPAKVVGLELLPARIGCKPSQSGDCPENKFLYKTYGLNIDLAGPIDPSVFGDEGIEVKVYPTVIATTPISVFLEVFGEQVTGPAIVRMRHVVTEDNPEGHIVGMIDQGADGRLRFRTTAPAYLDAPNLKLFGQTDSLLKHDIYSTEFELELSGPVRLIDDGRLLVTLETLNVVNLKANVGFEKVLKGLVELSLTIPAGGANLNLISLPVKQMPEGFQVAP